MIHLDTNLLIAAIDAAHPHHRHARDALSTLKPAAAASVAWTEFRSKPIPQVRLNALTAMLGARVIPFAKSEAELAAQLCQIAGVKRVQRMDTMIAATAILSGAELATVNTADFAPFVPYGLKLLPLSGVEAK
jgi:predicted nucleic acid-binding protein